MTPAPPPAPETAPRPRPRPHWLRSIALLFAPALLLLALLAGSGWWIASSASGLRAAAALASLLVPGLSLQGVSGSLHSGVHVQRGRLAGQRWSVTVEELAVELRGWSLRERRLDVERASAQRVAIDWVPSGQAAEPPSQLALPFDLILRDARVRELALGARDATPRVARDIALAGRMTPQGVEVERASGLVDHSRLTAQGRIGGSRPFSTQGAARLATSVSGRDVTIDFDATGSLETLQLALRADNTTTRARGQAEVHAFALQPLVRLQLDVADLDPAQWLEGVPSMLLSGQADLAPVARPGGTALVGPFAISNAAPGPLDRDRLPLRSARGRLDWSGERLALEIERAEGIRGTADGTLRWSTAQGVDAQLRFAGVDAATLDSRAVNTQASGRVNYRFAQGEQRFEGSARNSGGMPLAVELVGSIRDHVLELQTARLQLAEGRADFSGRLELRGAQALRVAGRFSNLDLARLARGLQTRLTGSLEIDGQLRPRSGSARFELTDSRVAGRPLSGSGRLDLDGQLLDADVDLRSGPARAVAHGGLGNGRTLKIDALVPQLDQVLPGYAGRVSLSVTLTGELATVSAEGSAIGSNLQLPGGHRVELASATFNGGRAPTAPLVLRATVTNHSGPGGPERSIAGAVLIGRGTTGDMTLELTGATAAQQPLRVIAQGGMQGDVWRGSLVAAEAGAPLDLLLRSPTPLVLGAAQVQFGPASFMLRGARFEGVELKRADGRWRTAGVFSEMQPQALDARARAPRRVVRSGSGERVPLTLAGRWDLELTDRGIAGIAVVERTGGDLYSGVDALSPIGVSDIGAAINVLDNRVNGNVYMRGRALGNIDAQIDAFLDPELRGGQLLAQDRPFRIVVDALLPDLSWIGPLIGDSVQFGGRGSVNAVIGGTPADPTSSGTLRGEALRLAWVDQAVRLEGGSLDAVLEDGVLVLREALFEGTPRAAPGDNRALEGLQTGKPNAVRAVGRVALSSLTGSIGITATQLPVLQRSDRWMVLSGTGGVTLRPDRAELYAKLTVDGAYINFAGARNARSLPPDVTVLRPGGPRRLAGAAPVDVRLDVQAELGQRFYIEGAGLSTRLTGALNVTGRPSQLRGEGTVQTADGTFAGYGQRLKIQRGIFTFQGPIDNPALNVLAIRTGLPVEVGVGVSGTAQRPIVRLYSDPSMSDTEKLNWLVLGRPPGQNDGNDRALLSAAASALFAGQADRASTGLMRSLGVDQITLQSGQSSASLLPRETVAGRLRSSGATASTTASTEFLAVGKRINEDLFLSFEQALTGAEYFVALNYRLSRSLSLIARAGSTNAIDLVYSIAFD